MPRKSVYVRETTLENRRNVLENLDETYPEWLEYNATGGLYLPAEIPSLKVSGQNIELLQPGNPHIDLHVRIRRSGKDLQSIDLDEDRLEAFFDALAFSFLGRGVEVRPRLRSADLKIKSPVTEETVAQAIQVVESLESIHEEKANEVERALKWYRQSFRSTSVFNHYSMLWNSLEIVTSFHGKEDAASTDERIESAKSFLEERWDSLELRDLVYVYNEIVQGSLRAEMTRGFKMLFSDDSRFPIQLCFEREPKETRLWKVRNDINHGNIVERNLSHRGRVESVFFDLNKTAWNSLSKALNLGREIPWER